MKKHIMIVTGGDICDSFVSSYIQDKSYDYKIACDSGMGFFRRLGLTPDLILGDYDSASSEDMSWMNSLSEAQTVKYPAEKDMTDTELGIRTALEMGAETIDLFGATGSRLDHVLGTVHTLGLGIEKGCDIRMIDAHSRVTMIKGPCEREIEASKQFGGFVSLIPFAGVCKGVTLTGFKYSLTDVALKPFVSLGISNEITADSAQIKIEEGYLLIIEAGD